METKKVKERFEIDTKYKWDLTTMYASDALWEEDYKKVSKLADEFSKYQGRLTESDSNLLAALRDMDSLDLLLGKMFCYAKMRQDEDNTNGKYQELFGRCMSLATDISSKMSFFTPELLEASEEKILGYIQKNKNLELYSFSLKNTLRMKKHVLSANEESILAKLGAVTSASDTIFSMLNDADMKFGEVCGEDGNYFELTHGNYIQAMESSDRKLRKSAYEAMYGQYKAHINTITATYNTNVKAGCIKAEIRKFDSARKAALYGNNIPTEVYDNLISVVHEYLPVLHKYIAIRKKVLGLDELKMYDIYTPLVEVPDKSISFDDATEIMKKALAVLGEDYVKVMEEGINSRWIDIYENKGKTSGAYSFGSYDSHPFILLNYGGKLQDVLTLVHEMGHSMHSYYTRKTQPPVYGDYSIFVAEVASTVNESLLLNYLLNNESDKASKMYILNKFIEEFRATVFRQSMFAEFELWAHKYVEGGGSLTSERLCEEYDKLNSLYFGDALSHDEYIQYEWARIPHFYRSFYVYQYATGFSAATAISKRILSEGENAVNDYRKFLTLGSSAFPMDELKIAGVDMSKPDSIRDAMEMFKSLLDEFESMI
ncbi:MAG: oligoendopeptidase F [Eubacterium sp.]|nr:oligoendopeptidase F [Eubacterium sp.]